MKKIIPKVFIDKTYSSPPGKHYQANKIIYNRIDEFLAFDPMVMPDDKFLNSKGFTYLLVLLMSFQNKLGVFHWRV